MGGIFIVVTQLIILFYINKTYYGRVYSGDFFADLMLIDMILIYGIRRYKERFKFKIVIVGFALILLLNSVSFYVGRPSIGYDDAKELISEEFKGTIEFIEEDDQLNSMMIKDPTHFSINKMYYYIVRKNNVNYEVVVDPITLDVIIYE